MASFDVRNISCFFLLSFPSFQFCLCKFKDPVTQEFLKILHHFCMQNLYFSINPTKITFVLFYKNLFSILNFTASGRFRTTATFEMELFCDTVTTTNHLLLSQIVPPYMLQVTNGGDSVLCLWSVANVTHNFSNKLVPYFIRILDSQSHFSGRETNKNLWIFQELLKNMIPKYYTLIFSWCYSPGNYM